MDVKVSRYHGLSLITVATERRAQGVADGYPDKPEPERDMVDEAREEVADAFNYIDWEIERCQAMNYHPGHALTFRAMMLEAWAWLDMYEVDKNRHEQGQLSGNPG